MTDKYRINSPRKLVEVALPLDIINKASVRESYIYRGNPSSVHKWWAQRPLAAARAVIFSQLVNDPGYQHGGGFKYGINKKEAAIARKRLFDLIEELVTWENMANEDVLERARNEMRRSWREVCELNKEHPDAKQLFDPNKLPAFHDPFAGGGTIPLEAQRLGLDVFASDLNPVAVLINKSIFEFPGRFIGCSPIHPDILADRTLIDRDWHQLEGLASDIRMFGAWVLREAARRVGDLYPQVIVEESLQKERPDLEASEGDNLPVLAWIWARTVKSPNPAFSHVDVPLASTFVLSSKTGANVYLEPLLERDSYSFSVRMGKPPSSARNGTKAGSRGANFRCILSDAPISGDYIKNEAAAGRMGARLLSVVVESPAGRKYLAPTPSLEKTPVAPEGAWASDIEFFQKALGFRVGNYGMKKWSDLFTTRQLITLSTFADLMIEVRKLIQEKGNATDLPRDDRHLQDGGCGILAYAELVSTYLAFALDKHAMYGNSLVPWYGKENRPSMLFTQQTLPMVWDFAEVNPFSKIGGSFHKSIEVVCQSLSGLACAPTLAVVTQESATNVSTSCRVAISTDPPYYDNVGYGDLSDFFYVWLRRSLRDVFPELFSTISSPKADELVATPDRHGGRELSEQFFLQNMTVAISKIAENSHPALPITIYYAFKQSETRQDAGTTSTGWETFLEAVIDSGLTIVGTWPMRTERSGRMRDNASNALASSVILVCKTRTSAAQVSRREFIRELNEFLPDALDEMTKGAADEQSPVAPVDLSQAIIGPGMAVFSKYSAVLEADGEPMTVRTALQLINRFLAEDDFDKDTQFCLHWFDQYGWDKGVFGEADVLARAKATSVDGLAESGVIKSGGGKVRLLRWNEYPNDWDPATDTRTPVWEALHHLIRGLKQGGEDTAGKLLAGVQSQAEAARQLSYRLYTLCERKGRAEDARAYNELITSWSAIESATPRNVQQELF